MAARPTTIDNESLLEAARDIFLTRGWSATTAAIAKAAGVSEGTLFNRFGNKEQLFEAAMGLRDFQVEDLFDFDDLIGKGDLRENLHLISVRMVVFYRELLPRLHQVCTHPEFSKKDFAGPDAPEPPPLRLLRCIARYLDGEMRVGRLRTVDPEIIARAFLGSLHGYVFFEQTGINHKLPLDGDTYIDGLIDALLVGIGSDSGM